MEKRIKEIIEKPDTVAIDQKDMVYVVQEYIKEKKGVHVPIIMPGESHPMFNVMPKALFIQAIYKPACDKLAHAYMYAKLHFQTKNK